MLLLVVYLCTVGTYSEMGIWENSHLSYHPYTILSDGIPGGGAVSGDSEREEAEGAQ